MIHFTVYSRSYCHLCDDMLHALQAMQVPDATITVVDVDGDDRLVARYDELVPVLTARIDAQPERRLCHYFLDEAAVRGLMAEQDIAAMTKRFDAVEANLRLEGGDPSGNLQYEDIKARMIEGNLTAEDARKEILAAYSRKPAEQ